MLEFWILYIFYLCRSLLGGVKSISRQHFSRQLKFSILSKVFGSTNNLCLYWWKLSKTPFSVFFFFLTNSFLCRTYRLYGCTGGIAQGGLSDSTEFLSSHSVWFPSYIETCSSSYCSKSWGLMRFEPHLSLSSSSPGSLKFGYRLVHKIGGVYTICRASSEKSAFSQTTLHSSFWKGFPEQTQAMKKYSKKKADTPLLSSSCLRRRIMRPRFHRQWAVARHVIHDRRDLDLVHI
jgi:hypothetical protein